MVYNNTQCTCGGDYGGIIDCHPDLHYSELRRGAWIGTLPDNDSYYLAGECPYCSFFNSNRTTILPQDGHNLTAVLCNKINRMGVLCGKCSAGYGLSVYGLECVVCPENVEKYSWILYILAYILPIVLLFLVVILFNISATSGPANAFIFFAQVLPTAFNLDGDGTIFLSKTEKFLKTSYVTIYDIWNLNFFHALPKFCLGSNVSTQLLLSLGYITAFAPLILVILFSAFVWAYGKGFKPIVCLCTPLHKCFVWFRQMRCFSKLSVDLSRSTLHALATFIVLSYTKFTLVSLILLTGTPLVDDMGRLQRNVLYYDGTVQFMGKEHRPFVAVSVLVLLTFVALPPIILILPSVVLLLKKIYKYCFKKEMSFSDGFCKCECFHQSSLIVDQFLNSFHGCYKDGTDSTQGMNIDCRWFAGFYFLLRFILFTVFAFTPSWSLQYVTQQLVCIVALLMVVILRPYKRDLFNIFDALIFANLATLSALSMYNFHVTITEDHTDLWPFVLQYILIFSPLLIIVYIVWRKCRSLRKEEKTTKQMEEVVDPDDDSKREFDLEFSQYIDGGLLQEQGGYGTVTHSVVTVPELHPAI